jgi:hypothetical protein
MKLFFTEREYGYSSRDQTACSNSLRVEGKQILHILRKPEILPTWELRQTTNYCRCETMFMVWTVYASLSATPPDRLIPLPFTSKGRGTHIIVPTTVHTAPDNKGKCRAYILHSYAKQEAAGNNIEKSLNHTRLLNSCLRKRS